MFNYSHASSYYNTHLQLFSWNMCLVGLSIINFPSYRCRIKIMPWDTDWILVSVPLNNEGINKQWNDYAIFFATIIDEKLKLARKMYYSHEIYWLGRIKVTWELASHSFYKYNSPHTRSNKSYEQILNIILHINQFLNKGFSKTPWWYLISNDTFQCFTLIIVLWTIALCYHV